MSIDVIKLAEQAQKMADAQPFQGADLWRQMRDRYFVALVLEEAAKVCDVTPPQPFRPSIEAAHAIRALKPQE